MANRLKNAAFLKNSISLSRCELRILYYLYNKHMLEISATCGKVRHKQCNSPTKTTPRDAGGYPEHVPLLFTQAAANQTALLELQLEHTLKIVLT